MKLINPSSLPTLHPDPAINAEVTIESLCNMLNAARIGCYKALEMNVVTPHATAMKSAVRWALRESDLAAMTD